MYIGAEFGFSIFVHMRYQFLVVLGFLGFDSVAVGLIAFVGFEVVVMTGGVARLVRFGVVLRFTGFGCFSFFGLLGLALI